MKRGEIWLVHIPYLGTHEQSGSRPCVALATPMRQLATVIPVTSNLNVLRLPYTISIQPSPRNGLTRESVALVFHIRTIDTQYFLRRMGILERERMQEITEQLRRLLGM